MDCRVKYSNEIRENILDIANYGKNSIELIKPNVMLLPIGGMYNNEKLQTLANTTEWAKVIKSKVDKTYDPKFYTSQVVIDPKSDPRGTLVNIQISSRLVDAYEVKNGQKPLEMFQLDNNVYYGLKASAILESSKAIEWFRKADKNNWRGDIFWNKLSQDLQIPKEQVNILKSLEVTNPYNREELLTSLLANYSYTVEINIGKSSFKKYDGTNDDDMPHSLEEFEHEINQNSQHYSNLTVPGGTNYTEQEISTPLITPSIKGHAQFSTSNGIGWFRSDDYKKGIQFNRIENLKKKKQLIKMWGNDPKYSKLLSGNIKVYNDRTTGEINSGGGIVITEDNNIYNLHQDDLEPILRGQTSKDYILDKEYGGELTKTRRILEVQSDIFQKSRDIKSAEDIYNEMKKSGELIVDCG